MNKTVEKKIETLLENSQLTDYDWQLRRLRETLNDLEDLYNKDEIDYDHYLAAKHNVATQMGQLADKHRSYLQKNNTTKFEIT